MVDSPLLSSHDLSATLRQWKVRAADAQALAALTPGQRARSVVIVQDSFTRYFETGQLQVLIELAARLGFQVWLAPLLPNGKPLHVQGFLGAFARAAIRNAGQLARLAQSGIPLVGLDPAMTLAYRQEYPKVPGMGEVPKVALPQEWLLQALPQAQAGGGSEGLSFRLLPHCTEKTNAPDSGRQWVQLFERRGLRLSVEATGCCGMSGTYGHEARNLENSRTLYAQSWARQVEGRQEQGEPLATGYSCRSQAKRLSQRQLRHPLQALLDHVRAAQVG
jgi:Fe-S oxidoreductase